MTVSQIFKFPGVFSLRNSNTPMSPTEVAVTLVVRSQVTVNYMSRDLALKQVWRKTGYK